MATSIIINFPTELSDMFERVQLAAFGYEPSPPPRCRPFKCTSQGERKDRPGLQEKDEPVPSTSKGTGNESTESKTGKEASEGCSFMEMLQDMLEGKNDIATVSEEEGLNVTLDVHDFKPDELSVKVVDGAIVVEGRTDQDQCELFSRNFKRTYPIPADCDSDKTFSLLSPDGILTVGVPKKERETPKTEQTSN